MIGMFVALAMLGQAEAVLTDETLLAYAARPWDQAEKMHRYEIVGRHHGALVVADFPCSDLCPDYTIRVIHYELAAGQACEKIGGVWKLVRSPGWDMDRTWCVPRGAGFVGQTVIRYHPGGGRGPVATYLVGEVCQRLPLPWQLDPGLRRGGVSSW